MGLATMSLSVVSLPWLPPPPEDWAARCKAAAADGVGRTIQQLSGYALGARQLLALSRALAKRRAADADMAPLSAFRLGMLASNTVDLVIDCLPASAARHGVAAEIIAAPYDQVMQQALDPSSAINEAKLDAVFVSVDHRWLKLDSVNLSQNPAGRVSEAIDRLRAVVEALRANGGAPAILQTLPAPPHSTFGSYDRRMAGSLRALIDAANLAIVALAGETGSYLLDTAALAERIGGDRWFDPVQWASYKLPFAAECGPVFADHVGRLLGAIRGKARKCLVLDLDNTVWGGVIGDDGLEGIQIAEGNARGEAFRAVQRLAIEMRDRGVFLAVCSKNDDHTARRPFKEHAEMLLREEHISVFQANWTDKASNLESIAKALNIGVDALVLLDDNPAERAQVRAALPMVGVPELPDDPNWYTWILNSAGYFEAVTFSAEDRMRAEAVVADGQRAEVMAKSRDLGDYLSSLEMVISFAPFEPVGRQRIVQLINKTNQFNLTTRRYTEAEVVALEADAGVYTLQVRLRDKFGDLGMIGVVICKPAAGAVQAWDIDTWLMSCRVLGRHVEQAMLAQLAAEAAKRGVVELRGRYVPTPKNGMVAEHFGKLGFAKVEIGGGPGTAWSLQLADFAQPKLPMTVEGGAGLVADARP
jgi:FkbH-like protein